MATFEVLSLFLGVLGFCAVIIQLHIANKSIKADHERRRKQATIEYGGTIWIEGRFQLESIYGTEPLSDNQLNEIRNDPEQDAMVRRLLGSLEYMAVGINSGIYSEEILYRMTATSFIAMFRQFEKYIKAKRVSTPTVYLELEQIVKSFEKHKKMDLSRGNIKLS